ncbi:MAG TPA: Rieske (2Fe-2S) protein [Bradyrhizobium sp.]|jgi:nitrite reductase/ring-hydroxylating ferredoxin subunit|nr:Rieske (2Fe-2S) protein [Bradyrhizobium sp.]
MHTQDRWLPVCSLNRLIAEGLVSVRVAGVDLVLIWTDNHAVACERACPHEQADLAAGHVANGRLFCPRHAASFNLRSGAMSPGWPSRGLRLYPVEVVNGEVVVDATALLART